MATNRINNTKPVVNGSSVVAPGGGPPPLYSPPDRIQETPDTTGAIFAVVADRYLYHGGVGGSGAWEK